MEEVDQAAAAAGRLGMSTNRFVDTQRADLALPPGAQWRPVRVAFKRCVPRRTGLWISEHCTCGHQEVACGAFNSLK